MKSREEAKAEVAREDRRAAQLKLMDDPVLTLLGILTEELLSDAQARGYVARVHRLNEAFYVTVESKWGRWRRPMDLDVSELSKGEWEVLAEAPLREESFRG